MLDSYANGGSKKGGETQSEGVVLRTSPLAGLAPRRASGCREGLPSSLPLPASAPVPLGAWRGSASLHLAFQHPVCGARVVEKAPQSWARTPVSGDDTPQVAERL